MENQEVVVWAFDSPPITDDPEVWQGQERGDGGFDWYPEEISLSQFLIELVARATPSSRA